MWLNCGYYNWKIVACTCLYRKYCAMKPDTAMKPKWHILQSWPIAFWADAAIWKEVFLQFMAMLHKIQGLLQQFKFIFTFNWTLNFWTSESAIIVLTPCGHITQSWCNLLSYGPTWLPKSAITNIHRLLFNACFRQRGWIIFVVGSLMLSFFVSNYGSGLFPAICVLLWKGIFHPGLLDYSQMWLCWKQETDCECCGRGQRAVEIQQEKND